MKLLCCVLILTGLASAALAGEGRKIAPVAVGSFGQEVRAFYGTGEGLPSSDALAVAVDPRDGAVYAGTAGGLARFAEGQWAPVPGMQGSAVPLVAAAAPRDSLTAPIRTDGGWAEGRDLGPVGVLAVFRDGVCLPDGKPLAPIPVETRAAGGLNCLAIGRRAVFLGTDNGLFVLAVDETQDRLHFAPVPELAGLLGKSSSVRDVAVGPAGEVLVAAEAGVFYSEDLTDWQELEPQGAGRSWAPRDVRAVAFDTLGRAWFASPQGVGCLAEGWHLYTGADGLPYDDFTAMAAGEQGAVWFGTAIGAVHYDGRHWAYRQGLRWLPADAIRDVAVAPDGAAWFATGNGVGCIRRTPMTFAEKAAYYEDAIDRYHRRTEYGFVLEVGLAAPGDTSEVHRSDSDNDGLWTSMYGAGECFAYAATKDPKAKARAKAAFDAMKFLGDVTQGGTHPAPPGFVARSVLPTSGRNPNDGDTPERDRERQSSDRYWKVIDPRWPISEDGKWYWKTDTSSDELDGHYFLYAQYYDLVADTDEERARVREQVRGLTDHLIDHDFCLVDHDGKPTRWAVFSPKALNGDPNWFAERGLNSLSMLSYLAVAEHVTGDPKYRAAADSLIQEHHYGQNLLMPKLQAGVGSGNQSDDEMAFMSYYNLIKYETDPALRALYAFSLSRYWRLEEPELNPFFNFIYAASCQGLSFTDAFGPHPLFGADRAWLDDAVETLMRFPLDRCDWRHLNSHRKDIVFLPTHTYTFDSRPSGRGYRVNGKALPVDEQYFNHWSVDVWALDTGGSGAGMGDGAVFLLPYYMGLHHGFIE
ncbi:MAG: hypothetical protein JXR94_22550 [Candidatus Hydrogenedentes bacterium]|nr:hypothetical protein [Candidatus Hydrogenedentota bacterium]